MLGLTSALKDISVLGETFPSLAESILEQASVAGEAGVPMVTSALSETSDTVVGDVEGHVG